MVGNVAGLWKMQHTHTHTHNHENPDTLTNTASNHQKALHFQTFDTINFMRAVICKLKRDLL